MRGHQVIRRRVAVEAVDHHVGRQPLQEIAHRPHVLLPREQRHFAGVIHRLHRRAADDVQVVDLDRLDGQAGQGVGRRHHVVVRLARQIQDDVGAQVQAAALAAAHGVEEGVVVMAAVHPVERAVVDALQAQLQADVAVAGVLLQQIQHRVGHGVGPRADGEADDLRMVQRLVVEPAQALDRGVRVGGRLEVGEEALDLVAAAEQLDAALAPGPGRSRAAGGGWG